MSSASVTGVAPCLIKLLVPSARGSSGEPGTAKTSRPCSSASGAVISKPERLAASTMNAKGETRNQPIAARKVSRPRFPSEWHFSQSQPGGQDVIKEIGMFGGINAILAAGENCDGSGCKAGAMRRGIDAAR